MFRAPHDHGPDTLARGEQPPFARWDALGISGRAELEKARGHLEQPPRIFELYRRKLADDADEIAGTVATVPLELELAFREVMAGG